MLVNLHIFRNFSDFPLLRCYYRPVTNSILTAFTVINILFLFPLFTFILFLGFQQWRKRRSSSSSATLTHADAFTYHMVAMEMIGSLASAVQCVSVYTDHLEVMMYSSQLFNATWCVKVQLHMLTCVDLHLAVVHPVLYLRLKDSDGVRIRNISVGCVWLLTFSFYALVYYCNAFHLLILYFCHVSFVVIVISFCCISVLWTLRRPAPGDGTKQRVDQSKRRAFNTICTIMGVLWLYLGGMLVFDAVESLLGKSLNDLCFSAACSVWFALPSSLVLPLLFLQRAGKLPCWKH